MTTTESAYRTEVLQAAWQVASLLDRNAASLTRGSFSRIHWAWKFGDFPFPRMQEAVYTLGRLYDLPGDDNPFYRSDAVAQWVEWGFEYWASLQHRSGCFDEAYPNEQCLAATAFTTFYLGSAFLAWRDRLPDALRSRLDSVFRKAGDWLCRNDETHGILSNHLAVAVAALEVMSRICDEPRFAARAEYFLERIFAHQSAEGWMKEYDGADVGYGTHGFFYLAAYWQATGCSRTLAALKRFAEFLRYFVHPDGTIGGEYGSRNTEFYYPAGFEMTAAQCPHSAAIARRLRESFRLRQVCGVWSMDVFNLFPMLNNLLFALDAEQPFVNGKPLPYETAPFNKLFPEAGLWIVNQPACYIVIGLSKGGTVSIFDKQTQRLVARHAGLTCYRDGRCYTSQDYTLRPNLEVSDDARTVKLDVPWKIIQVPTFNTPLFLAFRAFTLTLGRFPSIARFVKNLLVKVLIRRKSRPAIRHLRTLEISGNDVLIADELTLPAGFERLETHEQFTAIHMGSALYCDRRAVEMSTGRHAFAVTGRVRLSACLGKNGARWSAGVATPCAASAA